MARAVGASALLLVGLCAPGTASRVGAATRAPLCAPQDLRVVHGPPMSMATGEHAQGFDVVNRGPSSCAVSGYPSVTLTDSSGAALPFHYAHRDQYVRTLAPATVTLAPGRAAAFVVAKYRCDLGDLRLATGATVSLRASGPSGRAVFHLAMWHRVYLSYCRGGPADPGQVVAVTTFARSLGALLAG